ncbi:hypothetical protein [Halobellus captivus]|uniref:hypothetical protein n=1 Tax=Halobellus captivus TaxID=2592614 RepID=UPI0011A8C6B8|nr:hypothetical protein [Halobellus captivus]
MSSVPHTPDLPLERDSLRRGFGVASAVIRTGLRNLKAVSFWTAIVLPFTYVPLLVGGLTGGEALLFAGLIAINALAFVGGHGYEPTESTEPRRA